MANTLTVEDLAGLIMKTGHSHHRAYIAADGIDPEWASWYAPFLQAQLFDVVENIPTRSDLTQMLVQAAIDHPVGDNPEWPKKCAADMLPRILGE